jgi:hypothetical protein
MSLDVPWGCGLPHGSLESGNDPAQYIMGLAGTVGSIVFDGVDLVGRGRRAARGIGYVPRA